MALAPDIPTFAEIGLPAVSLPVWFALFAPKGTPKEINDRLNAAAVEALADPGARSRRADLGMEVFPREQQTPETLGALVKAGAEKWWPIIKEFGIKANDEAPSEYYTKSGCGPRPSAPGKLAKDRR